MITFNQILKRAQRRKCKRSGIVYNEDWTDQFKRIKYTTNELKHYKQMEKESKQIRKEKEKENESKRSVSQDSPKIG